MGSTTNTPDRQRSLRTGGTRLAGRVRLDRALSKLGGASRAEAARLIAAGRVTVGGEVVDDPARPVVPERDWLAIDGQAVRRRGWRMIALHKPRGVVTTRRDPDGRPTVFDLLGEASEGLVTVGRLDLATSGLLLLTTDTQLANWLTDPANRIVRRYIVTARGEVTDADASRMAAGVNGLVASEVHIRKRSARETHLVVELTEGRNREVRRLFEGIGREVMRLKRVSFGGFELGELQPGRWRRIARPEVALACPDARLSAATPS